MGPELHHRAVSITQCSLERHCIASVRHMGGVGLEVAGLEECAGTLWHQLPLTKADPAAVKCLTSQPQTDSMCLFPCCQINCCGSHTRHGGKGEREREENKGKGKGRREGEGSRGEERREETGWPIT